MKRVAIYLSGVHDISGGGGAERFFADLFSIYQNHQNRKFELFFFCDESTFNALKNVGKLQEIKNVVLLKNISNRFKKKLENIDFQRKLKKYKIDLVHCANYGRQDFDRLDGLENKKVLRVLNIVDCQVPYVLSDENDSRFSVYKERYLDQPQKIKFDGVFSWYEKFIQFFKEKKHYPWNPTMFSIQSRFADTSKFKPSSQKEKVIVFASRMHFQKRPDWFIKAISILKNEKLKELTNWKFYFLGDGYLSKEMEALIIAEGLEDLIVRKLSRDLSTIYPTTSCYVSTQDFENFPSLSMMEAMACGNAIIARNVGQTSLMVDDEKNGLLLKEDSPEGLVEMLKKYIKSTDDERIAMQKESVRILEEVHTSASFISQIEDFWVTLLKEE